MTDHHEPKPRFRIKFLDGGELALKLVLSGVAFVVAVYLIYKGILHVWPELARER